MPVKGVQGEGVETRDKKTKGSAAMKASSRAAPKKMVQAQLPFKRLNPVPKENGTLEDKKIKGTQNLSPDSSSLHALNSSREDLENDDQMDTEELLPLPKAVNGKGPLDHYLKKASKDVCPVIDLTEDSNSGIPDNKLPNGEIQTQLQNGSFSSESGPPSPLPSTDQCNTSMETETQEKEDNCKLKEQNSDYHASRVTCSPKLPVTDMEDNTALKLSPQKDSSAEEESSAPSSTSSPVSAVSSPEAHSGLQEEDCTSPSCLTTPVRKVTVQNSSTEKKNPRSKEHDEKRKKLQAEKQEREKTREEAKVAKERAKEEAKKKRDEEKEMKEKERKEKKEKEDREKAEKLRLKEEKKKEKLEAIEAKQEEKRKKEEEKRLKEEEKRMKAEKAEITRFLKKPKTQKAPKTFASFCGKFAPFEIKKNMAVAPLCRVDFELEASEQLDKLMEEQNVEVTFLAEIKNRKPRRMGSTIVPIVPVLSSEVDEVQVLEEPDIALDGEVLIMEPVKHENVPERRQFGRMKLLQFCENNRPAYWGTWNRKSECICPRKPWARDSKMLDYEVDSDEEWEEEEPGESLSHSEGEEEDEPKEEEDDEDDGFFVPHGYLSEDEGASDVECTDPENKKVRQRLKAKEWDELLSKGKKIRVLQPVVIGCVWQGSDQSEIRLLQRFATSMLESPSAEDDLAQEISAERTLKDREILSQLLPLLHGNANGSKVIIHEYQECCRRGLFSDGCTSTTSSGASSPCSPSSRQQTPGSNITLPSKARLKRIISENSVYEKRPDHRMCWYVHAEVLKSFEQEKLPVPCQWTYITQVNSSAKEDNSTSSSTGGTIQPTQTTPVSVKRKSAGSMSITKFMKRTKDLGMTETRETDGFQADNEEDEEEEDCMIVEESQSKDADTSKTVCDMEVTTNDSAATNKT